MQPFLLNRHDRIVFPSNFVPELDLSAVETLEQLDTVIRRDFETKAPTGSDILKRVEDGDYTSRYELMRDVALNMFWVDRFAMTMYEKRPTRWRDVPRRRSDVFLPIVTPWEDGDQKVAAVKAAYGALPPTWDGEAEDRIFDDPVRRLRPPEAPRHRALRGQADRRRDPRRPRPTSPSGSTATTRTSRPTGSTTSSTAPRTPRSSRPCTAGRWCCTTSTRGTGPRPSSSRSASSRTTTSWWPSTPATGRSAASCAGWTSGHQPVPSAPAREATAARPALPDGGRARRSSP